MIEIEILRLVAGRWSDDFGDGEDGGHGDVAGEVQVRPLGERVAPRVTLVLINKERGKGKVNEKAS